MLDERCLRVLEYFNQQCLRCAYKIFETEEVAKSMPKALGMDKNAVLDCVRTLSAREYVSVKYWGDDEICLTPTSSGRLVFEKRIDSEIEKCTTTRKTFLCAFLGALVGGGAIILISLFLRLAGAY